jgi:predicted MFS family arabinose efflux permease
MKPGRVKESPIALMKSVVSNHSQLTGLIFMFFLVMGHFTIIPFIAPSMIANVGLSQEQLPLIYLVGGGVSIIAGPLVGKICDKYGLRKIFAYSVAFAIAPVLLLTNLRPMALPLVLLVVAMFFVSNSGRWIPAMSLLSSAVLPEHRGAYMSFVSSVQNISAAVAAYVAGTIVTTSPDGKLLHYPVIGIVAIVCGIISFLLSLRVKQLS